MQPIAQVEIIKTLTQFFTIIANVFFFHINLEKRNEIELKVSSRNWQTRLNTPY